MANLWIVFLLLFCISCKEDIQTVRMGDDIEGSWMVTSLIERDFYPIGSLFHIIQSGDIHFDDHNEYSIVFDHQLKNQYIYKISRTEDENIQHIWFSIIVFEGVVYSSPWHYKLDHMIDFIVSGQMPVNEFARFYQSLGEKFLSSI